MGRSGGLSRGNRAETSRVRAARLWKQRWRVGGWSRGTSRWRSRGSTPSGAELAGFHHHAAMVLLAYGFLLLEVERKPTRMGAEMTTTREPATPERVPEIGPC